MEEQPSPNNEANQEETPAPKDDKEDTIEGGTLLEAAGKAYKAEFASSFVPTFIYAMLSICVLAVGLWQPWTLYVTLPFIGIPLFFALQITLSDARQGHPFSNKGYFSFFGLYFKMPYLGVYRVIGNLLWAFLISLLLSLLFNGIYMSVASATDPLFSSGLQSLLSAYEKTDLSAFNAVLVGNASINLYYFVSAIIEIGTWFLLSVYKLSIWCLNPYIRAALKRSTPNPRVANSLFLGGYRSALPDIRKELFKALWPGLALLVLGFAAGAGVGCLWSAEADRVIASGIIGSFIFTIFYLPFFFIVIELIASHFDGIFAKYSVSFAERALQQLEETKRLSDEEAKQIQKMIDDAKNGKVTDNGDDKDDNDNDYE